MVYMVIWCYMLHVMATFRQPSRFAAMKTPSRNNSATPESRAAPAEDFRWEPHILHQAARPKEPAAEPPKI